LKELESKIEDRIRERIRVYITESRYRHSLGVRDTAVQLARIYGCRRQKAAIAALLHDIARDIPLETMRRLVEENIAWFSTDFVITDNPLLLHAYAGSVIARKEFGIDDEAILRSIELHTTGGQSMGVLEKVIFVADFIEPSRRFNGVQKARKQAHVNLDETVLYIYKFMLKHLLKKELFICKNTLLGYNEIILRIKK